MTSGLPGIRLPSLMSRAGSWGVRSALEPGRERGFYRPEIRKHEGRHPAQCSGRHYHEPGGVGTGIFDDFTAVEKFLHMKERRRPNRELAELYREKRKMFDKLYEALLPLYRGMR